MIHEIPWSSHFWLPVRMHFLRTPSWRRCTVSHFPIPLFLLSAYTESMGTGCCCTPHKKYLGAYTGYIDIEKAPHFCRDLSAPSLTQEHSSLSGDPTQVLYPRRSNLNSSCFLYGSYFSKNTSTWSLQFFFTPSIIVYLPDLGSRLIWQHEPVWIFDWRQWQGPIVG